MSSDKRQKEAHKKEKPIKMESKIENKVCVFNKHGYCKYKSNCQKKHDHQTCEIGNCDKYSCENGHPKLCKYFETYQKYKFCSYCKFKHTEKYSNNNKMETTITALEKSITNNKIYIGRNQRKTSKDGKFTP